MSLRAVGRRTRGVLFGAAVTVALLFGARSALAGTAASPQCWPPSVGTCSTTSQCTALCQAIHPSLIRGKCVSGCCYCSTS